jgi:GTP-binding protein
LKTIADVGLIGYPNVGKSSILSVVTSAKPKIGNYHFTTLTPNLGILRRFGKDIVIADIPGLIEGAADGAGLGHDFLRHVERTRLLLHVVDISGSEGRDPLDDLDQINTELDHYGRLAELPQIIVCNKTDLPNADKNLERMRILGDGMGCPVFAVSAATHEGFEDLLDETAKMLETLPPILHFQEEANEDDLKETKETSFDIEMDGPVFAVTGEGMDRLIESVNFDDTDSINWFHRTLRKMGVIDALRDKGAGEGSVVRIAEMEFDFVE